MDRLTIEKSVEKQDDWRVELFDITGRKVLTRNLSGDIRKSVINTSEYPSGVYFLNITGSVKAFTKLMIVK